MSLLSLQGVSTFYGAIQALKDVSLEVREGEIVTLIGANGAGKSTLMMTVCGSPQARSGRIVYDGADIAQLPTHLIMRRRIAQAPEGRRIFGRMTVRENLIMGAEVAGHTDIAPLLDQVCDLFPRLRERLTQRGGTLSGGEQQMLAIGRCLMGEPRLIMFDEPSLGLAPAVVQEVFRIVKRLNEEGLTILLVEQNVMASLKIAHRGYVLENGRVELSGSGAELLADDRVRRAYLGL